MASGASERSTPLLEDETPSQAEPRPTKTRKKLAVSAALFSAAVCCGWLRLPGSRPALRRHDGSNAAFDQAAAGSARAADLAAPLSECECDDHTSDLPCLHILGGPALPARKPWVARLCTPLYEGPLCSNSSSFEGVVSLCLNGRRIHGVEVTTHGHVSKLFPSRKQNFNLALSSELPLLGMAPARQWILEMSFVDSSFQRNPTAFEIYRKLGGWATKTQFVNLHWHGENFGVYTLGERIERHPGRLQCPESQPEEPQKSGYVLQVDWGTETPGAFAAVSPITQTAFNVDYPKSLSEKQKSFLKRLVKEVDERALKGATMHSDTRLHEVLDFESFTRFYILEELVKDVDGYAFSDYMMVQEGKLMHAAPWDFDLAMGFDCAKYYFRNILTNQTNMGVEGWNVENSRDGALWISKDGWPNGGRLDFGMNKRLLFTNIWRNAPFSKAFVKAWQVAREPGGALTDESITEMISRHSTMVSAAAQKDLDRWRGTNRCAFFECCHREDTQDFAAAHRHLQNFLLGRAAWMDAHVRDLPKRWM